MKIAIVVGTRPEIIKMAPVISWLGKEDFFLVHTGQHYDKNMSMLFFEELKLPYPKYSLEIKDRDNTAIAEQMREELEKVLEKEKPQLVLAEGDTDSVLAAALAAKKKGIKFGHVEAGLRSRDNSMPEELNRITADIVSDYLFAPTHEAEGNLKEEKIHGSIFLTGNTIVDAVYRNIKIAEEQSDIINKLKIKNKDFFLLTFHRKENVDDKKRFQSMIKGMRKVNEKFSKKIVFPIHPRTKKQAVKLGVELPEFLDITEPVGYLDMLMLVKNASVVFTDSGGLQEESCILKTPCVTLRDNTERPETIEIGSNYLSGINPEQILNCAEKALNTKQEWSNPFGDGNSGKRIVEIISKVLN